DPRHLHSFPTRRSSDLIEVKNGGLAAVGIPAVRRPALPAIQTWLMLPVVILPPHHHHILVPDQALPHLLPAVSDGDGAAGLPLRSEEHTSELQSRRDLV